MNNDEQWLHFEQHPIDSLVGEVRCILFNMFASVTHA